MVLPSHWQRAWDEAQPRLRQWTEATRIESWHYMQHVGQLDAELLDEELMQTLQEPLTKALSFVDNSFRTKFEPELALLLRAVLYKFSLWDLGTTYGAKLQGLHYLCSNTAGGALAPSGIPRRALALHACLTVLLPYLHRRLGSHALSNAWPDAPSSDGRRRVWEMLNKLEALHSTSALFSYVTFLWNGKYRTLADRLVSMKLVPVQRFSSRQVSYEFMNRQMIWHAFTESLLLLLPLFRSQAFRRSFNRLYATTKKLQQSIMSSPISSKQHAKLANTIPKGRFFDLPPDQCAICADRATTNLISLPNNVDYASFTASIASASVTGSPNNELTSSQETGPPSYPITTPYTASCGHVYCHYCLSDTLLRAIDDGEEGWACLRCTESVRSCERAHALCIDDSVHTSDGWASDEGGLTSFESDLSFDSESELLES